MPSSPPVQGPSAFDLLSKFTRLRESGTNRDDAWHQVCDAAGSLPEVTYKAFLGLAKNWERREGHKYHYRAANASSADDTLTRKPAGLQAYLSQRAEPEPPSPQAPPSPPAAAPRSGPALTGTLDSTRLRPHDQQRLEQILDQLDDLPDDNRPPQPPRAASSTPAVGPGRTAPVGYSPGHFGPRTILLMFFKTQPQPLRIRIAGEDELFIGRATANAAMSPEIDLNGVNGGEYGVSRMHAAITRRNNQLLICDLESMNYTYINGVRLLPNEVRPLQDGDEIWFGQLRCRIRFQQG